MKCESERLTSTGPYILFTSPPSTTQTWKKRPRRKNGNLKRMEFPVEKGLKPSLEFHFFLIELSLCNREYNNQCAWCKSKIVKIIRTRRWQEQNATVEPHKALSEAYPPSLGAPTTNESITISYHVFLYCT